jgi:hypothetical protein
MSDLVSVVQNMQDLRDCESLIHAFCFFIDHGQAEKVVELFADDGVFERLGHALRGHAEISAAMAARSPRVITRHVCSNIMLEAQAPARMTGVTYFELFRHDRGGAAEAQAPAPSELLEAVGEYHDAFEKTAQGWRFTHRVALAVFQRQP